MIEDGEIWQRVRTIAYQPHSVCACECVVARVCPPLHMRLEIWVECEAAADAPVSDGAAAAGRCVGCSAASSSLLRLLLFLFPQTETRLLLQREKARYRHYLPLLSLQLRSNMTEGSRPECVSCEDTFFTRSGRRNMELDRRLFCV